MEAIWNNVVGETKRDVWGNLDWHAHWHSMDENQRGHIRNHLPPTPGFWMHSMGNGSPDLPGSAAFHYAADGSNSSVVRHVTNGTHGYIHTLSPAEETSTTSQNSKRAFLTDPNDSFSFDNSIAGIKLSYVHPCNSNYGDFSDSDMDGLISSFLQDLLAGRHRQIRYRDR